MSNQFANLVWKSTTRVGFGVKGKWVVAWYCQTKATPGDSLASKNNIGRQCRKSGTNSCLNDNQLKAHNDKRKMHDTAPLEWDKDLALALQQAMDAKSDTDFTIDGVVMPTKYSDAGCQQNEFSEEDEPKKVL
jgi:hypothetical protein